MAHSLSGIFSPFAKRSPSLESQKAASRKQSIPTGIVGARIRQIDAKGHSEDDNNRVQDDAAQRERESTTVG